MMPLHRRPKASARVSGGLPLCQETEQQALPTAEISQSRDTPIRGS
jgi:hypothetical protein